VCRRERYEGIQPDILHCIGHTPLLRVNRISKAAGLQCDLCKALPLTIILYIRRFVVFNNLYSGLGGVDRSVEYRSY
jgi:hypothetical protein